MITIYTIAYNEEIFLQFMIDHYRKRFPDCKIVVYDNMSTDNTVAIAKLNNCEVISYDTNNQIQDAKYLEIKNNCWKNAETDWVLICDVDELLDINKGQLEVEEALNATIIKSEGYNMINMEDNYDLPNIKYGSRFEPYDKFYLFNKKFISDINYKPGCHSADPVGKCVQSNTAYRLYHYNFINENLTIQKYDLYKKRLSPENIQNGWGLQYLHSPERIRTQYYTGRQKAIKII